MRRTNFGWSGARRRNNFAAEVTAMSEADGEKSSLPGVRTPGLPAGYDAVAEAKRLMRGQRSGALATIARDDGHPFATLVAAAADHDGTPILLLSQLSEHTKNLLVDARASL